MPVNQQQLDYLKAIGVPVWISRSLRVPNDEAPSFHDPESQSVANTLSNALGVEATPDTTEPKVRGPEGIQAAAELIENLQASPVQQIADLAASLDDAAPEVVAPLTRSDLDGMSWASLETAVSNCKSCDLGEKRMQTVFGSGNQQADVMIVGDLPRQLDEQSKQPFSGEIGELLTNMLQYADVNFNQVYLCNLLKCRTPLENSPTSNQASSCLAFLKHQIRLLSPKLVILLGRSTAQQVLSQSESMAALRLKQHRVEAVDTQFVVSYHPAYLLRQPRLKSLVWKDIQFIREVLSDG